MIRRLPLLLALLALLAGCTPAPATPGASASPGTAATAKPASTAKPSSAPSTAVGTGERTYTGGSLTVDGAAVALPTALLITKIGTGDAVNRVYSVGIPAAIKEGEWYMAITYSQQGAATNLMVQLNKKTGPRVQDLLMLAFARVDTGKGGAPVISPPGATGTLKEADGKLDIAFEGELSGVPAGKHQIKASLPGLPLE